MTGLVVDNLNIDMRPLDIPGYVNSAHMEDLARTVDSLSDNARLLEIGCGYGRSTICTLNHMKPTQTLTVVASVNLEHCDVGRVVCAPR